jgi:hypothetical protein
MILFWVVKPCSLIVRYQHMSLRDVTTQKNKFIKFAISVCLHLSTYNNLDFHEVFLKFVDRFQGYLNLYNNNRHYT